MDYILTLTGSIVTDKEQSKDGANMWQQLAERAIERGYSVWKIDRNKLTKSATKFESVADFMTSVMNCMELPQDSRII